MTDTKPTPRADTAWGKYHALPQQSDGSEAFDLLIDTLGDLREVERELQSIRSAELPVEPELWGVERDLVDIKDYDALKAYALKEKERADTWDALYKEQWQRAEKAESELAALRNDLDMQKQVSFCLGRLVEDKDKDRIYFRDKYNALRGRLMEPDEEMMEVYRAAFISEKRFDGREVFKAMTAVALKEGK